MGKNNKLERKTKTNHDGPLFLYGIKLKGVHSYVKQKSFIKCYKYELTLNQVSKDPRTEITIAIESFLNDAWETDFLKNNLIDVIVDVESLIKLNRSGVQVQFCTKFNM